MSARKGRASGGPRLASSSAAPSPVPKDATADISPRAAHSYGRRLRSRTGRGLFHESLEQIGQVERQPEVGETAPSRVIRPLDGTLQVPRYRLHVHVELADDRLEPALRARAGPAGHEGRYDEHCRDRGRGDYRSHHLNPTTPLRLTVFRETATRYGALERRLRHCDDLAETATGERARWSARISRPGRWAFSCPPSFCVEKALDLQ